MLPAAALLRCPVCASELAPAGPGTLRCVRRHTFDIARQGYVNLLAGSPPAGAETAEMVAARADLFAAGHFDFLTDALARAAAELARGWPSPAGLIVDVGAGTGHHLAGILDRLPSHQGLALDVSKAAARRAARAHPRAGAIVCDAWRRLPLADACADLVLDVFAPRNGAEFHRVLRTSGALLVVMARPDHLAEVVDVLGLIGVDPDKHHRLEATLGRWFALDRSVPYAHRLALSRPEAARLVAMGPSAWHIQPSEVKERLARLPAPIEVTAAVELRRYRPRAQVERSTSSHPHGGA
jgi:23S rRNA (guanine745-N1)-methyltransferase